MSNVATIKNNKPASVKTLLTGENSKSLQNRFTEILGKKAPGFISSIINVSNLSALKDADPMSVVSSAVVAATLDLPIDPNLGFAYVVPYSDNKKKIKSAQFQMGYKGFIQLAMRSGQYKTINAGILYKGDIKRVNRLTGEIEINEDNEDTEEIAGYVAYFKLLNGFEKALYMTKEEIEKHAIKYSASYRSKKAWVKESSLWTTNFDIMAQKTVLKRLLSKYGVLSIEMQNAIKADQSVVDKKIIEKGESIDNNISYVDNTSATEVKYEDVKEEIKENANKEKIDIEEPKIEKDEKTVIDVDAEPVEADDLPY